MYAHKENGERVGERLKYYDIDGRNLSYKKVYPEAGGPLQFEQKWASSGRLTKERTLFPSGHTKSLKEWHDNGKLSRSVEYTDNNNIVYLPFLNVTT